MSSSSLSVPGRLFALVYGVVAYALFLVTILYAIGFVGNLWPVLGLSGDWFRSMDVESKPASVANALLVNVGLLTLFAVQHSGMARNGFKQWWSRIIPQQLERSTFVLTASLSLCLLFWQWRPLGAVVLWDVTRNAAGSALTVVSIVGWVLVFASTFMIDHFDLFGLRQSWFAFRGQSYAESAFKTPGLYQLVRHPIYLGFIVAFWATPVMTIGHLLFASVTTTYILFAIQLEERDLVTRYGDRYRHYRERVRMLLPLPRDTEEAPVSRPPDTARMAR